MHNLRSLVLNSAYEPLTFTTARRALVLVLLGKAEPLESDGFFARTVSASYRLPIVVKLNRYVRKPGRFGVAFSRKNVLRRDNYTCQYCGARGKELTIDHITPRSSGGESVWDNVVTACRTCNLRKGNKSPGSSGLTLRKAPVRPRFLIYPSMTYGSHPASHIKSWTKYLARPASLR